MTDFNFADRIKTERMFEKRRATQMNDQEKLPTKEEKLLNYILSLTPEQADKIVNHLPQLSALLSESNQFYPQELSLQTP